MALIEGEIYRCPDPDPDCGCEVTVAKGAAPEYGGDNDLVCCCGHSMEKAS